MLYNLNNYDTEILKTDWFNFNLEAFEIKVLK